MAEAGERRFGQGLFRFSGEFPGTLGRLAEYGTCEGAFFAACRQERGFPA